MDVYYADIFRGSGRSIVLRLAIHKLVRIEYNIDSFDTESNLNLYWIF